MAAFSLNIYSPTFTSKTKTNQKLTHKSFFSTPNIFSKPSSFYHLTTTYKQHQKAPISASIARQESVQVENQQSQNIILRPDLIPKHVAMIMEKQHDLLPAGSGSLIDIARICCDLGIKVLSFYTCSTENNRKKDGVVFPMNIKKSDLEELSRNDFRVSFIGNRKAIPSSVLEIITQLEEATKNNNSFHIIETVNYSGTFDIIQSCVTLAEKVSDGSLQPEEIDETFFEQGLETTKLSAFPNPDLVIRTGGRSNVGNFMLWQSAYSEICFVEKPALEFSKTDFVEVLNVFQKRNRRFGGSDKK